MSESRLHDQLVSVILEHVRRHYRDFLIFDDRTAMSSHKPPRVGGFVPDVYAVNVPTTRIVIGEAKTFRDLQTPHTDAQMRAFLDHLALSDQGTLIVAVPWMAVATARSLVTRSQNAVLPCPVKTVFLHAVDRWTRG